MTIGDAIDHLTEAREHLKAGTPEYIAVVAAHDILRDLRESPPQAPAAGPDLTLHDMGYEPGDYFGHCHRCKAGFLGDKRALTCFSCAVEMRAAKMGVPPPPASPSPDLLEAARRAVKEWNDWNNWDDNAPSQEWLEAMESLEAALASTPRPPEAAPAAQGLTTGPLLFEITSYNHWLDQGRDLAHNCPVPPGEDRTIYIDAAGLAIRHGRHFRTARFPVRVYAMRPDDMPSAAAPASPAPKEADHE